MVPGVPAGAGRRRPRATPGSAPAFLASSISPRRRLQVPQGPCFQSLLRSRSCVRAGAPSAPHILGGGSQRMIFWGGRGDTPSIRCQCPVVPRFRVTGPVDSLLLVRGNVSRGPGGAEFPLAPLYASYLGSCCPSQCIGVRVPGNRPANPRGRPALESPILSGAYAVSRLALPRACWVVCRPRAPLRQPQSVPTSRGRYAVRPAISARGRFPLRCGPVPRSALLTNGGRHSRAPDFLGLGTVAWEIESCPVRVWARQVERNVAGMDATQLSYEEEFEEEVDKEKIIDEPVSV
ncbi:hypothetical protein NDU88_006346 [Pleurodeles waltl]|uniref:Uncharacterized protein n=1 Tax=Pleurodeles waltl TaxID=8319 RepID=A0AAV7TY88_PLEWA|nr:hypothetical protein NDU88_006346 [Pleurodeles waltl]